jgi:hypothetical protein
MALVRVVDPAHLIELAPVPARTVDAGDRAGVVEERLLAPELGLELEPVLDVRQPVAVVVDVDRVEDVVAELEEVRPARRVLQRDVVGDDRDRVRLVRADERVRVRVVCDRVLADLRRLAM